MKYLNLLFKYAHLLGSFSPQNWLPTLTKREKTPSFQKPRPLTSTDFICSKPTQIIRSLMYQGSYIRREAKLFWEETHFVILPFHALVAKRLLIPSVCFLVTKSPFTCPCNSARKITDVTTATTPTNYCFTRVRSSVSFPP